MSLHQSFLCQKQIVVRFLLIPFDDCTKWSSIFTLNDFIVLYFLAIGDQILNQLEINTDRQIQRTCDAAIEKEKRRIEHEYHEKSNELLKIWKNQLEDEKKNLQKVRICIFFSLKNNQERRGTNLSFIERNSMRLLKKWKKHVSKEIEPIKKFLNVE